jgi:hypothetical protein
MLLTRSLVLFGGLLSMRAFTVARNQSAGKIELFHFFVVALCDVIKYV